jgi:hypothetical protein
LLAAPAEICRYAGGLGEFQDDLIDLANAESDADRVVAIDHVVVRADGANGAMGTGPFSVSLTSSR